MRYLRRVSYVKWLLVLPAVGILLFIGAFPFIFSLGISFGEWPRFPGMPFRWVGILNYLRAIKDPTFINSLVVTFKYIIWAVSLQFTIGLCLALALLNVKKGRKILCGYLLIPSTLAPVAVGIVWLLIFSTLHGPLNAILEKIGIQPIDWLGSPRTALISIIVADVWQWTPFLMIIILSGLVSLPLEPFEAAKIDGASPWQTFLYITFPLLKPVLLIALVLRLIDAIKIFDLVAVITKGGPGGATKVLTYYIYNQAFMYWSLSYAAALTFFILPITIVIVSVYFKITKTVYYY